MKETGFGARGEPQSHLIFQSLKAQSGSLSGAGVLCEGSGGVSWHCAGCTRAQRQPARFQSPLGPPRGANLHGPRRWVGVPYCGAN